MVLLCAAHAVAACRTDDILEDIEMQLKSLFALILLAIGAGVLAEEVALDRYVIECTIPGASELSAAELDAISQKSRDVLESLGPDIRWLHSYVAEDKFYCVYEAKDKALIAKHAELGGFPADRISRVSTVIDPSAAEDATGD